MSPPLVLALAAHVVVALTTGVVVLWLSGRYEGDPRSDAETAVSLRRVRRRGLLVGWAATALVTRAAAVPDRATDALAGAGSLAAPVGVLAAYLLPGVLVAVAVRLAGVPARRAVRGLRLRYRDAAAWELERGGVALVVVLGAAALIAFAPAGWPRVAVAVGLGFLATALSPIALVVALRTRWPTDEERAVVADLLPPGVRLRVVDDRTRVGSAFAAGVLPGLEHVFVTESLFDVLDDEQLRAVVAHEVGHHERHHVLLRFSLVAVPAAGALAVAAEAPRLALTGMVAGAIPLALVLAGVVRYTERSADAYAAEATSGAALASALEALADRRYLVEVTGLLRYVSGHPPLSDRLARLRGGDESGPVA